MSNSFTPVTISDSFSDLCQAPCPILDARDPATATRGVFDCILRGHDELETLKIPIASASSTTPPPLAYLQPCLDELSIIGDEEAKTCDILTENRTLTCIEDEQRLASSDEQQALRCFFSFGPLPPRSFPIPSPVVL